ncbi:sulfite exporter TauE/SafE family protein [Lacibacterium aquatile]|uniref:Sulfite exporter TauE/SafE family protein n=1 Tax=Lacibacterium aquatile TaxID=1168082 RepID=A0ABW5DX16_9PROT
MTWINAAPTRLRQTAAMEHLIALANLCVPAGFNLAGAFGLYGGLFLAGLTGSLFHCGPMCGPLVLAQAGARLEGAKLCETARWRAGLLPGYHLGRLSTYGVLGAVAGLLTPPPWLSSVLLILAALVLTSMGLRMLMPSLFPGIAATGGWVARLAPLFRQPRGMRSVVLGSLLGFLPCGLIYGGLAVAATTGNPVSGAVSMLAFGLGTVPMLGAIGLAGALASRRWQGRVRMVAPYLMLLGAGTVAGLAVVRLV